MTALEDTIRVEVRGTYLGQINRNVYHYNTTLASGTDTAKLIADTVAGSIVAASLPFQSPNFQYTEIVVENLDDELFFIEDPVSLVGTAPGEDLPSYVALGFKYVRTFKATRNGAKRLGGITEASVAGNTLTVSQPLVDTLTAAMLQQLDNTVNPSLTGVYAPIIFRPANSVPSAPAEFKNPVSAVELQPSATTQNSRKRGVGE